jgi:hypothetical protein
LAVQGANECLDILSTNPVVRRIPFRLNVDHIKTQWILTDESVQSFVAGFAEVLSFLLQASIAHADKECQHQPLQKCWRLLQDPGQEISSDGRVCLVDNLGDCFTWGKMIGWLLLLTVIFETNPALLGASERDILRELRQYPMSMRSGYVSSTCLPRCVICVTPRLGRSRR